jgi:hypothetical protein
MIEHPYPYLTLEAFAKVLADNWSASKDELGKELQEAGIEFFFGDDKPAQMVGFYERYKSEFAANALRRIREAALDGKLIFRHPMTKLPLPPKAFTSQSLRDFYYEVHYEDANEWLKQCRVPYRLPSQIDPGNDAHQEIGWKAEARKLADQIWKRDRAKGLTPSKLDMAKEIAPKLDGDLSPAYIVRHALNTWTRPK